MKTLKHLALCLAAAFIATGCSNDENEPVMAKKGTPAQFIMTISGGSNTRTVTTYNGNERSIDWREGDEVGIFAQSTDDDQQYINCKYTYNGNEWTTTDISNAITLEEGKTYNFYAYYPYTAGITANSAALNVSQDQSMLGESNSNYDLSDVLLSKLEGSEYTGAGINLTYNHAYAMVEVLVAGDKVGGKPSKVLLKNVNTDASIDLTTQAITPADNKQDVVMFYVENGDANGTYLYRAIVPEQTIKQGSVLLEVYGVDGGKNYMFKAPSNKDVKYPQGEYFRMEVTIGKYNAGIKFPAGNINPWKPTDGVNLDGEEIVTPITNLTLKFPTAIPEKIKGWGTFKIIGDETKWYWREGNLDDRTSITIVNENSVILTTEANTGSHNNSNIVLHYTDNPFENARYKATIKGNGASVGMAITNANDDNYFALSSGSSFEKFTTVRGASFSYEGVVTNYFDFSKKYTTGSGGNVNIENFTTATSDDVKNVNIYLYNYSKNATLTIEEVTIEKIIEE